MSFSKLTNKRLFLIGPPGHGKSRTGNTLLGENWLTYGDKRSRVTTEIQIETHENGLLLVDLPGYEKSQMR